ncbi:23S rRNA (pseudouridine(1915)-N(3))-methyltransferase RlmH [Myxococcota bacterium]|nr:23S rRNA (pseudouridine(1915)-N(3))-methyltransferase RlmH [Myxococcota bacterium]
MLRHHLLWPGRKARDPLIEAEDEYIKRTSRYAKIKKTLVREGSMDSEKDVLKRHISDDAWVIALDERGESWTTMKLAKRLQSFEKNNISEIIWLIGGADGLHPELKKRANVLLSLSAFTLPHRLAHVVLAEQIYRAHTILRNEKYHRE